MRFQQETVRVKVIPCEVYSRVVGYYRPVSNWNQGKQMEFKERKCVKIESFTLKTKKNEEVRYERER